MQLTIKVGFSDAVKISFIQEAIPLYGIKKISIENSIIPDKINVESQSHENCLHLIEKIKTFSNIGISEGDETSTTIVLWD